MVRFVAFIALSAILVYISRASLKKPRSHGLYRLFGWESILALVLLHFESFGQWFGDPLCARQIVSWVLLLTSIAPAIAGVHALHTQGRVQTQERADAPLLWIEKTTKLVKTGVYKYIRHPMYCSLLLLTWGVFFKKPSWVGGGLAMTATAFLFVTARAEETENTLYFGDAYRDYIRQTKMFLPFLL